MSINYKNQKGASLIMVLAIMIVIALMIIATGKSTNIESRTSFDDTDKKESHMLAETSLVVAEQNADNYYDEYHEEIKTTIADPDNKNKTTYYLARNDDGTITTKATKLVALINVNDNDDTPKQVWDISGVFDGQQPLATELKIDHNSSRKPLFIAEYFGEDMVRARVTVKAWGKGENNPTMLQSIVELSTPGSGSKGGPGPGSGSGSDPWVPPVVNPDKGDTIVIPKAPLVPPTPNNPNP